MDTLSHQDLLRIAQSAFNHKMTFNTTDEVALRQTLRHYPQQVHSEIIAAYTLNTHIFLYDYLLKKLEKA